MVRAGTVRSGFQCCNITELGFLGAPIATSRAAAPDLQCVGLVLSRYPPRKRGCANPPHNSRVPIALSGFPHGYESQFLGLAHGVVPVRVLWPSHARRTTWLI
jgi:hypothetical protein